MVEEDGWEKGATGRAKTAHNKARKPGSEAKGDTTDARSLPSAVDGNPNATPNAGTSGGNSPKP